MPDDLRVAEARAAMAKLNEEQWVAGVGETPADFRERIAQSYFQISDPEITEKQNREELRARRDRWIEERTDELRTQRNKEIDAQRDPRLREGGRFALKAEIQSFQSAALSGKNDNLNKLLADFESRQAARQEYITNYITGPALDAKLKELGLEHVQPEVVRSQESKQQSIFPKATSGQEQDQHRAHESEPETSLRGELKDLYKDVSRFQQSKGEERREKFDRPIDLFAADWEKRLKQERAAELRGCQTSATIASEVTGKPRESLYEKMRDAVADKYHDLKKAFEHSLRDLENGREPFLLSKTAQGRELSAEEQTQEQRRQQGRPR